MTADEAARHAGITPNNTYPNANVERRWQAAIIADWTDNADG